MKNVQIYLISTVFLTALFGCATIDSSKPTRTVTVDPLRPSFEKSHAIFIEDTIAGLDISEAVDGRVSRDERIVVVSIEGRTTTDLPINQIIDDNLISNLVSNGYSVLERDPAVLYRTGFEQTESFTGAIPESLSLHPSYILLRGLERYGLRYVDDVEADSHVPIERVDLDKALAFYEAMINEYDKIASNVGLASADVIVSYRLLECGVLYKITREEIRPETEDSLNNARLKVVLEREARARLFLRVMDAKTGQIRVARVLESTDNDTQTFEQQAGQSRSQFIRDVEVYQEYLERFHYTFYSQQLPNQDYYTIHGQSKASPLIVNLERTTSEIEESSSTRVEQDAASGGLSTNLKVLLGVGVPVGIILITTLIILSG